MDDAIYISDYVKSDPRESRLHNAKEERRLKMEEHRGVTYTNAGKAYVNERIFADYILRYRIDLFRLDSGERYIKNQKKHNYEQVSEVSLEKICMAVLDELDTALYVTVRENKVLGFFDKQAKSYWSLHLDNEHLLFPNGIFTIGDLSFDDKFETDAVLTYQMKFNYDPDAGCPIFEKALARMFPDDTEAVLAVVQEMFGYTFLYNASPADTLFYLYGGGRNGKSILSFVLRELHGEENVAGVSLAGLSERFNLSALVGKRICICPENAQAKLLDTSIIKALTGRDTVKVEEKYATPTGMVFHTKIIVNSNHYLRTDDDSTGFWERIQTIGFYVTFLSSKEIAKRSKSRYYRKRDTKLEMKLKQELPGIFNWAMKGLQRLRANGYVFTASKSVADLKNRMIAYCKPVLAYVEQNILQGNLDSGKGKRDKLKSSDVHARFLTWAEENMLEVADYRNPRRFRKVFLESLEEKGISAGVTKNSVDYYTGIDYR